ncbi:MAG: HEAT repeat domain-containing protein, partial [Planctomycetes bacterium]|nr:HEAT repeat domain-containing protein [Planctomycetota bacterium]
MTVFRTLALMVVAAACVLPALGGEKPDEAKLIAIISSDAPPQDKAIPCKQLAVWGTKAAVPALAALLPNRELSSWARIALEAIPDPACDEALRAAVGKLEGRLLVGVINSIGVRRDAQAIGILVAKLKDPDPEVASAAAEALGRIGGDQPIKVLEPLLASAPPAVRSSVAYGCVLCAERLLDEKKAEE